MFHFTELNPSPLLPFKLWYLFYFAAQFTQIFIPLILDQSMNFSLGTIGFIICARRLVIFIVAPLFTWLCDITLHHHRLLTIAHVCYYFCTFLLIYVRSLPAVITVLLFREAFVSGCEPSINNAAVAKLEELSVSQNQDGYGKLRLWGSFGWGLASFLGTYIIHNFFHGNLIVILHIQILLGVFVVSLVAFGLDLNQDLFLRQTERKQSTDVVLDLVLKSPRAIFCAVSILIQGTILGVLQMTAFIYFSSLGVSATSLGLSVFLGCGAEALFFFYDTVIWEKFGGPQAGFNIGLVANSIILVFYSLIQFTDYPTIFFISVEVFYGGIYALFLTSALALTNEMAPPSLTSTSQGALAALYAGIGPALGALLSGIAYERLGAPLLYSGLAMIQMIIYLFPIVLKIDISCRTNIGNEGNIDLEIAETTSLLNNTSAQSVNIRCEECVYATDPI